MNNKDTVEAEVAAQGRCLSSMHEVLLPFAAPEKLGTEAMPILIKPILNNILSSRPTWKGYKVLIKREADFPHEETQFCPVFSF